MKRFAIKSISLLILLSFCAHLCEISFLYLDLLLDSPHSDSAVNIVAPAEPPSLKTDLATLEQIGTQAVLYLTYESLPELGLITDHHDLCCQLSHKFSTPGAIKWIGPDRFALEMPSFPREVEFLAPSEIPWPYLLSPDIFHPPA